MMPFDSTSAERIPIGKVSVIWAVSGIALLSAFALYERLTGIQIEGIQRSLTVYLLQGGIFLLSAFLALSVAGIGWKSFLINACAGIRGHIKTAGKYILICLGAVTALVFLISVGGALLVELGGIDVQALRAHMPNPARLAEKAYLLGLLGSPLKFGLYLIVICIIIPAEEEIFFRRLLYTALRGKLGVGYSLTISAAMFGAVHPGGGFMSALFAGLVLGWVYERTRNVYANILIHGAINLCVTSIMILIA